MIDINEPVLFFITVQPAQQINKGPGVVTAHVGTQLQRFFQRRDMAAEVVNSRVVDDFAIDNR